MQKTCRFSRQRLFTEVYRPSPDFDRWRREVGATFDPATLAVQPARRLLPRGVPYPGFTLWMPVERRLRGALQPRTNGPEPWEGRADADVGKGFKGFSQAELEADPVAEIQQFTSVPDSMLHRGYDASIPLPLPAGRYEILDFGVNRTGFPGARITCRESTTVWFIFDEVLTAGDVDFKRQDCVRVVAWEMPPGVFDVETIEPCTFRYLKTAVPAGDCVLENVYLREYAHPVMDGARFQASDERLNDLFRAAVETNRQNALDLFTDCPSRERSGWLCDAFFTARATFDLTGFTRVERNFFENFLLAESFDPLPAGMLPMCYPAEHRDGTFIPAWALWFVVQLGEYAGRGGDPEIVEGLRPKVTRLLEFFEGYENADGLLEKLPGWEFVTYSAERYRWHVHYPTNMLYAGALSAAGRLYGLPGLERKADRVLETVRAQAFDGFLFADNALRRRRGLEVTGDRSEACQYFAFFFGAASPDTHRDLWRLIRDDLGPEDTGRRHGLRPAHLFVGKMLRLEILSRAGEAEQVLEEAVAYWHGMAEETGTLWEFFGPAASCCHGYASHVVRLLRRDALGLYDIDVVDRVVQVRFCRTGLERCEGRVPVPGGAVELAWRMEGRTLVYDLRTPPGYRVEIENRTNREVRRENRQ